MSGPDIDGFIESVDGMAIGNGASGFRVDQHATAFTVRAVATSNGAYGYDAVFGGYLARTEPQPSLGNVLGELTMPASSSNAANGAVIIQ